MVASCWVPLRVSLLPSTTSYTSFTVGIGYIFFCFFGYRCPFSLGAVGSTTVMVTVTIVETNITPWAVIMLSFSVNSRRRVVDDVPSTPVQDLVNFHGRVRMHVARKQRATTKMLFFIQRFPSQFIFFSCFIVWVGFYYKANIIQDFRYV